MKILAITSSLIPVPGVLLGFAGLAGYRRSRRKRSGRRGGQRAILLLLGVLAASLWAPSSEAVVILETVRANLGSNDFIDWGVLGPDLTIVADPFNINSNQGTVTATVSNPSGNFQRRTQPSSWAGNFAGGDALLFTNFTVGPIDIDFNAGVIAAGAQIQRNPLEPFTATLDVFDLDDVTLLASFNVGGNSSSAGDNSAIFVGAVSDAFDIGRIVYHVDHVDNDRNDFAINRLDLKTTQQPQIPEPATLLLLGSGLAGLGLAGWRRKRLPERPLQRLRVQGQA